MAEASAVIRYPPCDILLTDGDKDVHGEAEVALGDVCSLDGSTQLRNVALAGEGTREGGIVTEQSGEGMREGSQT